jgi:hypothetical protein
MDFIVACIFWILGLIVTSFTLIPSIIIIRFGIPMTKELEREKMLVHNHTIVKKYLISILVLTMVFAIITGLLYISTEHGFRGFIGGSIFSLLIGIWKTGNNKDNVDDYMRTNKRFFKSDLEK